MKAALRSAYGEEKIANEVSGYYVAGHLARTCEGMMIAIPTDEWRIFQGMSSICFIAILQQLATKVDLARFRKHPRLTNTMASVFTSSGSHPFHAGGDS